MLIMLQIVIGLFVLGILVLVHELGHFLFAKLFGIRVLSFSIGFGKVMISRQIGETEYRISAIPFGGYVHMAGEHPEDAREAAADEFNSKPIWQRATVAVAGPGFNYAFALFCLWLSFVVGVEQPLYLDNTLVGMVADSSEAQRAGILPGDRITSINGATVAGWNDIEKAFTNLKTEFTVGIDRGGIPITAHLARPIPDGDEPSRQPLAGLTPMVPPVVGGTRHGSAAEKAGIQATDSILTINGQTVHSWQQFSASVSGYDTSAGVMPVTVMRRGEMLAFALVPEYDKTEKRFLIGVNLAEPPSRIVRSDPVTATGQAWEESIRMVALIFESLDKLIRREVSPKQLAGPVGIVQMSGGIALMGFVRILNFMALIGINLGLLNLLPLIITDGGLLLFMLIEAVRRKPLPLKYQLAINRAAIAFFILLGLFVTFNDLSRITLLLRMTGK